MPILTKDGNIYKLQGPNPIMQNQDQWDKSQIILINFNFKEEVVIEEEDKEEVPIFQPIEEEIVIEEKRVVIPPPPSSTMSLTSPDQPPVYTTKKEENGKITIYCLPVIGENKFGGKIVAKGLIVEEEDLYGVFWIDIPIPQNSIIYPKNYSKRWWQIQQIKPKENGFLVFTVPTTLNPDFTD